MARRREFFLIFKEALNNLSKYSNATEAELSVIVAPKRITMVLSDNGIGFDPNALEGGGNGMHTMRQRAERLKGEITISSQPNQGTEIILKIPHHRK